MREKIVEMIKNLSKPLFAIFISLLFGAILILPTGTSPLEAYKILLIGAFGSWQGITTSLAYATPLLFTGLGAAYAFRAGVFNIGLEGQLYFGAIAAALVGVYTPEMPGFIHIILCIGAAMIAGMLWAIVPALLKIRYNIGVFITYIMFNNIAQLFSDYLATYPFKGELSIGATYKVSEKVFFPKLAGEMIDLNFGFVIAVALAIFLYVLLFKTQFGYESRAAGLNPDFSEYMGVDAVKKMVIVVMISGAIAGLAGAEQVLGVSHRYISSFSPGYGYTGITVALLARTNPLACIITAIFFGALNNGAIQMEIFTNISRDLVTSIQAIMIIFIAADFAWKQKKAKKNQDKKPAQSKEVA